MMLCQLLGREGWAKIGVSLADDRHRQRANFGGEPVIAWLAAALR
jgi:hypothetical protein